MTVSIILASYNRAELLRRGVKTILSQHLPFNVEIILVDDGSSDDTRKVCEELAEIARSKRIAFRYFYLNHPEPRISCIPRNVGIKKAEGDIIIFTEPEALQVSNTIEQLITKMRENPENTILASQVWTTQRLIAEELTEDEYAHPEKILRHKYAMLTDNEHPQNINAPDSDWSITGEKNCNAGVLFATRKEWLLKVGGFDESFTGHSFDDFDLFNRLSLIGHGIIKDPDIIVIHQWHDKSFYPYNVYEHAQKNGKISETNIHAGIFQVNKNKNWGEIE